MSFEAVEEAGMSMLEGMGIIADEAPVAAEATTEAVGGATGAEVSTAAAEAPAASTLTRSAVEEQGSKFLDSAKSAVKGGVAKIEQGIAAIGKNPAAFAKAGIMGLAYLRVTNMFDQAMNKIKSDPKYQIGLVIAVGGGVYLVFFRK